MAKKKKRNITARKTKIKLADLPTQQMTKAEEAIAKQYWNEHGASTFMPLLGLIVIIGAVIYMIVQQDGFMSEQYEESNVIMVVSFMVALILGAQFYSVVQDMSKRQTVCIEGIFTKKGETTTQYSQYLHQNVGGYLLIFPPKIYHNLEKGDYVVLHCTRFLQIVVDYQIVAHPINDGK